jgi:hypothetical protein
MRPGIDVRSWGQGGAARRLWACSLVALTAGMAAGCGDATRQGQSPAYLQVKELTAAPGAEPDKFQGTLYSDVVTVKDGVASTYSDLARVTMALALRDPGTSSLPTEPSAANYITVTRYRVRYVRADGRNTAGVDVPYGFDAGLTFTVGKGETTSPAFEIVRHVAKDEAPLGALASNGIIINTIAEVTFYGTDQTGREVSTVANLGINFGNFADPQQ